MSPIWDTISNIWNNLVGGGAEPTESEQISGYMGELAEADTGFTPSGGGGTISIPSVSQPNLPQQPTGGAFQPPISGAPTGGTGGFPSPAPGLQQPGFAPGQAPPVTQDLASQGIEEGIEGEGQPTPEQMQDPAWLAQHGGMAAPITSTDAAQFATSFMGGGGVAGLKRFWDSKGIMSKIALRTELKTINRIAQMFNKPQSNIAKILERKLIDKELNNAVNKMSVTKLAASIGSIGLTVSGVDILTDWAAIDNVIGTTSMFVRDVEQKVGYGTMNPVKALRMVEERMELVDMANAKLDASIKLNPLVWPFAKIIKAGGLAGTENIEDYIDFIREAAAKAEAQGITEEEGWKDRDTLEKEEVDIDRAYWADQAAEKQAQWEENQALIDARKQKEQAYWAAVRNAENAKDAEERAYWEAQAKKRKEEAPSKLGFGLL